MSKPIRLAFFIFFLFLIGSFEKTLAQGTSNKGTDFWLGYGTHIAHGTNAPETMVLYLTSDVNTTATVEISALAFSQTVAIKANVVSTVTIPLGAHLGVEGLSKMGIHISAIKPIIVYSHIYASAVSGATLVLPTNTLGKDYYSINYKQVSNASNSASFFFVVAVEDATQVEITPSQNTQGGWLANTKYTVNLNKGEIYHVMGAYTNTSGTLGVDLTGSKIKSVSSNGVCKKIAVFSGSSKISITCLNNTTSGTADNLFQQVYPTATWGKKFITVPLKDRNFDVYRILKSDPNAVVTLNGNIISAASFVNNLYYDFESQAVNNISSDKAIQVVQYSVTQGRGVNCTTVNNDVGDPEMIFLNPLEQTLTQITMYSSPYYLILKHFINVVVKNEGIASFKVDGLSKSTSFVPVIGNSAYSYAQIVVTEGTHNLACDFGFNAIAYGFGNVESYGYAAGANLTSFGIDPLVSSSRESVQSGCVDQSYDLTLKLPYSAVDIYLDKYDGIGLKTVPINLISQTTKDGETTYIYSIISSLIYSNAATYPYKVRAIKPTIDDCGTGDEFTFDFIINPKPLSNFSLTNKICITDTLALSSIPDPNEPNIGQYLWDFNGEGSASLKDPKFYFSTAGIKKIRFSMKSVAGCWSDVVEKSVEVFSAPVVNFSFPIPSCFSVATQFTDLSVATGQTISSWNWNFGDSTSTSNSSTLKNPSHTFSKVGTFNVKLTALSDAGCVNSIIKQVIINQNPVVDFLTPDICLNDASALFTNKTTIPDSSALTYLWDFGDNVTDVIQRTKQNPVHKYNASGFYNVKLKVSSLAGCVVEKIKVFTVNGSVPLGKFTVQNENALFCNVPVVFEDYSTVDFGGITKIEWYYDDALPTTVEIDNSPALRSDPAKLYKHSYPIFYSPTQKTVKVKMVAYSGLTCKATSEKVITLLAVPKVDFSLPNGCLTNGNAQFNDQTTFNGAESTLTYSWDFGDSGSGANNISSLKNPTHTYSALGNYQVKLKVKSMSGAESEIIKTFTVTGSVPSVSFDILDKDFLCSNKTVSFKNNSSVLFGNITKLEIIYEYSAAGNNSVSTDDAPLAGKIYTHQYPASSVDINYQVVFRVYSGLCYQESSPITITINGSPTLVFDAVKPVCANAPKFLLSSAKETTGIKGTATFAGKGVVGNYFDPSIANVGSYLITYTFTSSKGCIAQKTQTIVVNPIPIITFDSVSVAINILLAGEKKLNPTVIGNGLKYKWTPAKGLSADSILNPIASPTETTKYTLTVTSPDGCVSAADLTVIVHIDPFIPNAFSPNGDGINDTWSIKYLETFVNATIKIFNRYGQEVFNATQYNSPWDGRLKNADMPVGVYYYIIEPNNGRNRYTGSLTLLR